MRIAGMLALIFILLSIPMTATYADQALRFSTVYLGNGQYTHDRSGTFSYGGMTATWTFNDYDAEITITGNSSYPYIAFLLIWENTGDNLPLTVDIVSTTPAVYHLKPDFIIPGGVEDDLSLYQWDLTGNHFVGCEFPEAEDARFIIEFAETGVEYDITAVAVWGPGVPTESTSWEHLKSLYR